MFLYRLFKDDEFQLRQIKYLQFECYDKKLDIVYDGYFIYNNVDNAVVCKMWTDHNYYLNSNHKRYLKTGVSKCHPEDEFKLGKGCSIAFARAAKQVLLEIIDNKANECIKISNEILKLEYDIEHYNNHFKLNRKSRAIKKETK